MNEYIVYYTLDCNIIREKIVRDLDVKKEDVVQEVLEKVNQSKYLIVKSDKGDFKVKSSLIRYVMVRTRNLDN
ncbi:hypothetical protein QUF56_06940 [Ureibacillus composti]|nr:hypothetical protein [Ureibacillus composti]